MSPGRSRGITAAAARKLLLGLEGVQASTSYGMPSFMLREKFFARFRDDDTVLVLQLGSIDDRDVLMKMDPKAYFFTDHYRNYAAVLIRLADISRTRLAETLAVAWEDVSAKRTPRKKTRRGGSA